MFDGSETDLLTFFAHFDHQLKISKFCPYCALFELNENLIKSEKKPEKKICQKSTRDDIETPRVMHRFEDGRKRRLYS